MPIIRYRGPPGESGQLDVGPPRRLGEHAEVGDPEDTGDVDKVLDHVLGPHLDVAGRVGLHHLAEVAHQLLKSADDDQFYT